MSKWTLNSKKTGILIFAFIVTIIALESLQVAVQQIDVSILPAGFRPDFVALVAFVTTGGLLFVVAFGRNLFGYLRNYLSSDSGVPYNIQRLYGTWMYYLGFIGTSVAISKAFLPAEWYGLVTTVVSIATIAVDFVFSELKKQGLVMLETASPATPALKPT